MTTADLIRRTPCGRLGCLVIRAAGVISNQVSIYHHPHGEPRADAFLHTEAKTDYYQRQIRAWLRSLHPTEKKETDDG